ncbi:hypothetical protein T4E_6195 [Trichinella pseudospiralis]|uniref:Uncharacterized protein n=1 Tax=Trichinella pseudospiralis TaxID=6337 RepID=A0A0V0Y6T5_TRIPS|nr:hypothetical protein T4E_6195 [Trichinella pseudospiralis]
MVERSTGNRYKNFQQVINRDPCSLWNILSQYSDMDIIYEEGRSNGKERESLSTNQPSRLMIAS